MKTWTDEIDAADAADGYEEGPISAELLVLREAWRRVELLARRLDLSEPVAAASLREVAEKLDLVHDFLGEERLSAYGSDPGGGLSYTRHVEEN